MFPLSGHPDSKRSNACREHWHMQRNLHPGRFCSSESYLTAQRECICMADGCGHHLDAHLAFLPPSL